MPTHRYRYQSAEESYQAQKAKQIAKQRRVNIPRTTLKKISESLDILTSNPEYAIDLENFKNSAINIIMSAAKREYTST